MSLNAISHIRNYLLQASVVLSLSLGACCHNVEAADSCDMPVIAGKVDLDPACTYHGSVNIVHPTVLDCHGAVIDGDGRLATGIRIDSNGAPLRGVEIKNCVVHNFTKLGIGIGWSPPDGIKQRMLGTENSTAYEAHTPSDTTITDTEVQNIGGVGIYIDDHVVGTRLQHVAVQNSSGAGIYLEHDSRHTVIDAAVVENNGWKGGAGVQPGLAIDASQENIIRNSTFRNNGQGGIFLYRNCGERVGIDPNAVPRKIGANDNVIEGNHIYEKNGIRIAARMSRNVRAMQCGRKPYFDADGVQIVLDEARHNIVRGNVFREGKWGVVIEDDDNVLENNIFVGEFSGAPILVGTKYRTQLMHRPVIGTKIFENRIEGGVQPKWIYGSHP